MAGTCKKCGCMTTDTRERSPLGMCFNCEHGLTREAATPNGVSTAHNLDDGDLKHLAFSIAHGTFNPESPGGCSCDTCSTLREMIQELQNNEAADFYNEHYPPPGGFL